MVITLEQLKLIMPRMARNPNTAVQYLPLINAAMAEFQINTKLRIAAFLAQCAHESCELRYLSEIWGPTLQQLKYDPPSALAKRLGNTQKGDGYKYRGMGPIQLTGKDNFTRAGIALGLDLVNHPELAQKPENGFRLSAWFWFDKKINVHADIPDFDAVTKDVNGGYTDLEKRRAYYNVGLKVL